MRCDNLSHSPFYWNGLLSRSDWGRKIMRWTIYITSIFSSLLLTGLTFASFAWAAGEPGPSVEDRSSTPGAKKPLTVRPQSDPAGNTEPASTPESGAAGTSTVRMPEITIGGKVTPPA